jgi:predicted nucleic acid-binding protein
MVILLDTNVALNYIFRRDPFYRESDRIMTMCAEKKVDGYLAFHSIYKIWYVLRKMPDNERRGWLKTLCSVLGIAGAATEEVMDALENVQFKDFEDCLQDKCARHIHADYIITGNTKDFTNAETKAINPLEFCTLFGIGDEE